MDSLLLQEFKEANNKWFFTGSDEKTNNEFNEISDRFFKALRLEIPFEFFDGHKYQRVEKLGGFDSQCFYFSSEKDRECCDRLVYYRDIQSISPVREG